MHFVYFDGKVLYDLMINLKGQGLLINTVGRGSRTEELAQRTDHLIFVISMSWHEADGIIGARLPNGLYRRYLTCPKA